MSVVTRRLSARRGSTSAPDPYAKNAHLNRESSSILTIVRVTSPPLASPARRSHRRIGSNPSSPLPSPGSPDPPPPGRLSFAFSSFAAPHQPPSPGGAGSPRLRPASPHRTTSSPAFAKQRLSPEQLLEVAKQATNPRYVPPSPAVTPSATAASHSPILHPRSSSPQQHDGATVAPATFTPLPPDVYLPFLDRPVEVKALLSSPPSAKLFALLAQTFTKNVPPRKSDDLPINTADWTFADLSHWLTETTRDEADDSFWGALGVPPELDVEYTEAEYNDVFESDDESDEVLEDAGKKSVGHWEDWDATVASPVDLKSAGSSPSLSRSTTILPPGLSRTSSSTPTITTQLPTPANDETYFTFSPIGDLPPSGVIIEPVIASSELIAPHPPPLSLPASLSGDATGLGDIGEEDEEEESATPEAGATPGAAAERSLRSATTGVPLRSPSFSARDSHSPTFARSSSSSSLHRSGSFGSVRSVSSNDGPYDPVADRAPGNPIFPSNFARLAVGPTLAANNPALRSPTLPPQSKYGSGVRRSSSTRSVDRGNRFRRSWGTGTGTDDYAVTVASGSSAGGSVRDAGADEA
ncbi:hypothetical protein B0H13DRAFT_2049838 [Mycena leptocephala]|nr:hypothetical protein B0H13DRAFT_2049838 [Mycena leptocephala]